MRNVWKMPQLLQQFMNCGTSQIRTVSFQTSVIQWDKDLQIPPLNLRFFPSSSLKLPVENDTCLAKSSIFWHRFPAFPNWLVVDLPLWKIWVRQLGPIYGKIKKCSKPPTSVCWFHPRFITSDGLAPQVVISWFITHLSIIIVIICYNSHKPENVKLPI